MFKSVNPVPVSIGIAILIFALFSLSSCVPRRQLVYFIKADTTQRPVAAAYEPVIQPNDQVGVLLTSVDKQASSFFSFSSNDNSSTAPTYLVNSDGFIDVPLVGLFHIAGLTSNQAKDSLKTRFEKYINGPTIIVILKTFRVTMLGAVNHAGILESDNERMTIIEAIARSGDLNANARRDNILIVREKGNGREYGTVDITSRDILTSPYYNLHTNDIVYVEPGIRARLALNQIYVVTVSSLLGLATLGLIYFKK
jgi:polysaccharide export outer membrane protein